MGKKNKNQKDALDNESSIEAKDSKPPNSNEIENSNKRKKRKNKTNVVNNDDVKVAKPKKIKFNDDGDAIKVTPEESLNITSDVVKDKSLAGLKESDVKDEDIDQFCDEIDEEDNKQYESWIALLEEKLCDSNSKVKNKKKVK